MKKTIITLLICITAFASQAESIKLKSSSFATRYYSSYERVWGSWSQPKNTEVLVLLDADEDRITIYSSERQVYDIYKAYTMYYNESGDKVYEYSCLDSDGKQCTIRFHYVAAKRGGGMQIYACYSDMQWMYNVYSI